MKKTILQNSLKLLNPISLLSSVKLLLLGLIILSFLACQRIDKTYAGAEADPNSPPYTHEFNINNQNTK